MSIRTPFTFRENRSILLLMVVLLSACRPRVLKEKEAIEAITAGDEHTLLGGFSLGDSWTAVKRTAGESYEVREGGRAPELRRDLGGINNNTWYFSFKLGDDDTVERLSLEVVGYRSNVSAVPAIARAVVAHIDERLGGGSCDEPAPNGSYTCYWTSPDGIKARLSYSGGEDTRMIRAVFQRGGRLPL